MDNFIYAWGANQYGQLGLGYTSVQCNTPQQLTGLPFRTWEIEWLGVGRSHTLLVTCYGEFFGCGRNHQGQLGLRNVKDCSQFKLAGKYEFLKVFAGGDSSAGITWDGVLFVWGANVWQRKGASGAKACFTKPTQLTVPEVGFVLKVAFGMEYMVVLAKDGSVFVLGTCPILELANYPSEDRPHVTMSSIRHNGPFRDVAVGDYHLILLTEDQQIKCFGVENHAHCLDLGSVPENTVAKLEAGSRHSACTTTDGELFVWGANDHGQLGRTGLTCSSAAQQFTKPLDEVTAANVMPAPDDDAYRRMLAMFEKLGEIVEFHSFL